MFKTLKGKITMVYLCLVVTIGIIGFSSVISIYNIPNSINEYMASNYKSINAINNMLQTINSQNDGILIYLYLDKNKGINMFYQDNALFQKWYTVECNNITEPGEKNHVEKIKEYYMNYSIYFSQLQEIVNNKGLTSAVSYYDTEIILTYNKIKYELIKLSDLNEQSMFKNKDRAIKYAHTSMYIILLLSTIGVIGGFVFSRFSVNRSLKPIYSLQETIRSIKEGDLYKESPIISKDEIGDLAQEFNKMTKRLQQFEYSTMGKVITEKNKSIAIVKSISDPLIVLDTNYKISLLNASCEYLFKIKEENVLNKYLLEVIRNGDLYDYICQSSESKNEQLESKIFYLSLSEEDYYFNVIVNVVRDLDNIITGIVVLFENVTQLKQIQKIQNDFIAMISHEIKTPLTSIMIGASLITDTKIGFLNEKQKSIIETVKEDSERLSALVTNLIHLSKIESKHSMFNMKPCYINDIISNCINNIHDQAFLKQVFLEYTDNDLPKVCVDSEKVTWVINNLLSNALKYTNPEGKISIQTYVQQDKMCVEIKDTGIGIPEEYCHIIFNKFIQVSTQSSETKGSGLGLAIAKELIEAQSGEIWCESKLGTGTTFIFTLPLYL
jgi:signal transduction histidine kinase